MQNANEFVCNLAKQSYLHCMRIFDAPTFGKVVEMKFGESVRPRGALRQLSLAVGIHVTTLSQAINGRRPFSLEQVNQICAYFGLNELETRYCLFLVQRERAGTESLRAFFQKELDLIRRKSDTISQVVKKDRILSEADRAVFYSNWFYSGLAVLSSLPELQTAGALAKRTNIPLAKVSEVLKFLIGSGICKEQDGRVTPGSRSTHLPANSPFISRHHGNWRIRAMERHPGLQADTELAYSSPMSLSVKDAKKIRALLVSAIAEVSKIRDPSPCEEAYCLNIDWIKI